MKERLMEINRGEIKAGEDSITERERIKAEIGNFVL